jgi:hypothetical protein
LIANSVLASTFGVVIALLADSIGRVALGILLDREPVIYHNRVEFLAEGNEFALAGGAVGALLAGATFLAFYPGTKPRSAGRLALLWLVLHSFRQSFVALAMTPFRPESDVAVAIASLDLPSGVDLALGAAGALGLLLVSLAAAPAFLAFAADYRDQDAPARRLAFCAKVAVFPGVAGALLAVAFFLPDSGTGLIPQLPLYGLFTIVTLLAAPAIRPVQTPIDEDRQVLSWGLLATVIVTFLIFRFALSRGIPIPPDPEGFFYT